MLAIAGFSDGATYALSLGPRNAGLFTHIMAFSPGGVAPFGEVARARVFVSHGRKDSILPFANSVDRIVPGFKERGIDVRFEPFEGDHVFREEEIAGAGWFLAIDGGHYDGPSPNRLIWLPGSFGVGGRNRSVRRLEIRPC